MQLFLSGAQAKDYPQPSILKSLGGYISSNAVRNDTFNNLFDDFGKKDLTEKRSQCKGVFVRNILGADVSNFKIWYESLRDFKVQIALVTPNADGYIELLDSTYSSPIYGDFNNFNVIFSKCILQITNAPSGIETIELLGEEFDTTSNETDSIPNFIDFIVNQFIGNATYKVEKNDEESLLITKTVETPSIDLVELISSGDASATSVNFAGGVDNGVTVNTTLAQGEFLGIFLKLIPLTGVKTLDQKYQDFVQQKAIEKKQLYNQPLTLDDENFLTSMSDDGKNVDLRLHIEW